jgi:putative tryptophan/tyrosine transport system substrate-binding protein
MGHLVQPVILAYYFCEQSGFSPSELGRELRRRQIIKLLGMATAWPLAARAQRTITPLIGYLSSTGKFAEAGSVVAMREGLKERGFIDGVNVRIEYRWCDGDYGRLPRLAADLVNQNVNVITASGLPAALAAKEATSTIPIVFRLAVDPVASDLVASIDRPGGNITGVTALSDQLTPKKIQLLHELVPSALKIGFLIDPKNQNVASNKENAERAAETLGLRLSALAASRAEEIDSAFAAARRDAVNALLVSDDPVFGVVSYQLIDAAARSKIPTLYYDSGFVLAGGLISYGPSFDELARQQGGYLGRILEGAKPADLPVQQANKFELVINLKTAKSLGLSVPPSILASVDRVIDAD